MDPEIKPQLITSTDFRTAKNVIDLDKSHGRSAMDNSLISLSIDQQN